MAEFAANLGWVALFVMLLWLAFVVPYQMAERRNRSGGLWILISLVGSPFLAILLLIALGPDKTDRDI